MLDKLIALIKELIARKWYGKLEIAFEAGKLVNCKKIENIKLTEQ